MEGAPQLVDKADVEMAIMGVLSQVEVLGANDSERNTILGIVENYRAGKLSADKALSDAHEILETKQDYH